MPELKELVPISVLPEDTKASIRSKVWDYLDEYDIALSPKIPRRRISNFKGSLEAGEKIAELDVFKNAQILRIDPDRTLQEIRFKTLEAGKTLLVPTPRLKNHVVSKIVPPEGCSSELLRNCAARQGIEQHSSVIDLDEKIRVDVYVVGCVAVSPKGWRVGKGGGLSDLEYAMMASLDMVDRDVPVITMAHDCQVIDLPDSMFNEHDLPVDFIVTPTRVIECTGKSPKLGGIIWNLLDEDKLNHIPVLKRIRYRQWKAGLDVKLSGEEEVPVELNDVVLDEAETLEDARKGYRRNRRNFRRREFEDGEAGGDEDKKDRGDTRRNLSGRRWPNRDRYRSYKNRRFNRKFSESNGNVQADDEPRRRTRSSTSDKPGYRSYDERRTGQVKRQQFLDGIEGSIYVGSLPRSLRVSEFKTEVRGRKVNPLRVLWRGSSGFAFLNFKSQQDAEEALVALEGLQISDRAIKFEMAKSPTGQKRYGSSRNQVNENYEADGK